MREPDISTLQTTGHFHFAFTSRRESLTKQAEKYNFLLKLLFFVGKSEFFLVMEVASFFKGGSLSQ